METHGCIFPYLEEKDFPQAQEAYYFMGMFVTGRLGFPTHDFVNLNEVERGKVKEERANNVVKKWK